MTDLVGQTLGSYTITERIGGGGMADVYKAFHSGLSVHRAVKVIRPELSLTEDFRERFQKEARSVAALRHPNIVQMHDFGTHQNTYYMVMEFIEGHDLKRLLRSKGRIRPIQDVVDLIAQVADALAYAHGNGLIHRDIKPENIMITARGQAILTDFGIAKLLTGGTRLTQTGGTLGTPAYMAPEQALGNQEIGPPSDIYALTVVLYELLTGRTPFEADTPVASLLKTISNPLPMPQHLAPDVGDAVQGVIIKGTAKQPGDRFDSMVSLREALLDAARRDLAAQSDRATIVNTPPRTPPETLRPRSRTLIWVVAAGGAAIALAAGAAYWFTGSKPSENASVPTSQTTQPMDVTAPPVENRAATTPMASNDSRPPDPLPTATSEEPAEQRQGGATQATARGEQSILPQRVAAKSVEDWRCALAQSPKQRGRRSQNPPDRCPPRSRPKTWWPRYRLRARTRYSRAPALSLCRLPFRRAPRVVGSIKYGRDRRRRAT